MANYVDMDPGPTAKDFRCRARTYDAHDGVDLAIRDAGDMARGVPVLASAAGVVKGTRDGMDDAALTDEASRDRIKGRECGNGVVLDHGDGWQTQYCHLRKGSIAVKQGERVEVGGKLGLVGLSGKTEFPHVHLTVRLNGKAIDPFTGHPIGSGCGMQPKPLWADPQAVSYEEVAVYNVGFSTGKPDIEAIRNGKREEGPLAATSQALVLWADIFGVQAGDKILLRLVGPDGKPVVEQESRVERTQARRFVFAGSRPKTGGWPAGTYQGQVMLTRAVEGKETKHDVSRTVMVR